MNIEDIEEEWNKDSHIDMTDLAKESVNQFELHNKYYKILNIIKKQLRNYSAEKKRLAHLKNDYYNNTLAPQSLKELGWEPNQRTIIRSDLDKWVDADEDVIQINLKIGELNDMKDFLTSIIDNINRKAFVMKNLIEMKKFENGGY